MTTETKTIEYTEPTEAEIGFALGDTVTDSVTGIVGIAVSRSDMISGCVQFEVQPPVDAEGKIPQAYGIDFQRLTRTKAGPGPNPSMATERFKLGATIADVVTGFRGIATTRCTTMTGEVMYHVQPKADVTKNEYPKGTWLTPNRMVEVGAPIVPKQREGGCESAPARREVY